ncbi:MAG: hypothetical protein UY18_C0037G0009 [Microgenomates group bacterium GW2011_GWF2_47_9]|nr:MAG: hypothetical protein UY18_C0037G0009 [Microgenomates group bacterium GW2011_GWF2_47_9]
MTTKTPEEITAMAGGEISPQTLYSVTYRPLGGGPDITLATAGFEFPNNVFVYAGEIVGITPYVPPAERTD